MELIDLQAQRALIDHNLQLAIDKVLSHGRYILGPEVFELEDKLSKFSGVKYCITCANGTDALQVALMALGIGPGDEIITPGFSYISTAEAIAILGAKPVFIDVDAHTFNINVKLIEQSITSKTRAIIPVSLFGQTPDFDKINEIADRHNISVIEDAAQSFGASYKNKKSCALSTIGCTSFFPSKPLGCYGDGGAIFTNEEELAKKIRQICKHGQDKPYNHVRLGLNSRLDTIQAAILLIKLEIFPDEILRRNKVAKQYGEAFYQRNITDICPKINDYCVPVWAQYTIKVQDRKNLSEKFKKFGIPYNIYYPLPLYKQPSINNKLITLDTSERLAKEVLSIPMHPYLSSQDIVKIADIIKEFHQK